MAESRRELLEKLLREVALLLTTSDEQPERRYYTQRDSPLGKSRHLKLIRNGAIPGFKDGKSVFALREDVHAYIERHPVRAQTRTSLDKPVKEVRSKSLLERVKDI